MPRAFACHPRMPLAVQAAIQQGAWWGARATTQPRRLCATWACSRAGRLHDARLTALACEASRTALARCLRSSILPCRRSAG